MKRLNMKRLIVTLLIILIIAAATFYLISKGIPKKQEGLEQYKTYTYSGPGGDYIFTIVPNPEGSGARHVIEVNAGDVVYRYPLRYGPKELEEIPISGDVKEKLLFNGQTQKNTIYITQDPELPDKTDKFSAIAVIDINQVTGPASYGAFKIPTITAVTYENNSSIKNKLPVITCKDSSSKVGVIEIKLGAENKITQDENGCVILEGVDGQGILRVADKLILNMLGVF